MDTATENQVYLPLLPSSDPVRNVANTRTERKQRHSINDKT